jgi:thiosulfate/3-mercaptopyruvate sulfurtransferase
MIPTMHGLARPEILATTEWLAEQLGRPGLRVLDLRWRPDGTAAAVHAVGHIPGAVKVDWHLELNDQLTRDYLDPAAFAALCEAKGIGRDDTIVFYGDNFN